MDLSAFELRGTFEGALTVRDIEIYATVHITIPLSSEWERLEWTADIEYAGIYSGETHDNAYTAELDKLFLDSYLAQGDKPGPFTWRLLIENAAYQEIERVNGWVRESRGGEYKEDRDA